jgi:hypothetical protein
MNCLYFACQDCKIYIDAGYRWAYWELEEAAIVTRGKQVDIEKVLAAESYWNLDEEDSSHWLYTEIFPPLRKFIEEHREHHIVFDEEEGFVSGADQWDWMQIGYLLVPTPRYFLEVMGFTSWEQVKEYIGNMERPPWWWEIDWREEKPHEECKRKFEELVNKQTGV